MMSNQLGTNLAEVGTDAISRQQVIDALVAETIYTEEELKEYYEANSYRNEWLNGIYESIETVKQLPPIQPEPKRGKWIRTGSGSLYDHYECSECGKAPKWECMGDNRWKIAFTGFCPNCGAKMEVTT